MDQFWVMYKKQQRRRHMPKIIRNSSSVRVHSFSLLWFWVHVFHSVQLFSRSLHWLASNKIYKSVLHLRPQPKVIIQWCCTYSHPLFTVESLCESNKRKKTLPSFQSNTFHIWINCFFFHHETGAYDNAPCSQMQISDGLFVIRSYWNVQVCVKSQWFMDTNCIVINSIRNGFGLCQYLVKAFLDLIKPIDIEIPVNLIKFHDNGTLLRINVYLYRENVWIMKWGRCQSIRILSMSHKICFSIFHAILLFITNKIKFSL